MHNECIKVFSETDFNSDHQTIDALTFVICIVTRGSNPQPQTWQWCFIGTYGFGNLNRAARTAIMGAKAPRSSRAECPVPG